jgi:P4 family phage/plasmid primase-like protien
MATEQQPQPAPGDYNGWADFWRSIGLNVIPWNKGIDDKGVDRSKKVLWSEWQDKPIPLEKHEEWKRIGAFKDGIARIPGKCWHKNPFDDNPKLRWWDADMDNQSSIDAICTRKDGKQTTIKELSKSFIVEIHDDDPTRIHIGGYYESDTPLPKLNSGDICELKCDGSHGVVRCTNSLHYHKDAHGKYVENGNRFKIIEGGTLDPVNDKAFVDNILSKSKAYGGGNGHAERNEKVGDAKSQSRKYGELELEPDDIQGITEPIQPYYKDGQRNSIILGLSGILRREGICEISTSSVIEELARNDGISRENDIEKALKLVEETYKKDPKDVAGKKYFLVNILFPITGSRQIAGDIFSKVFNVIRKVQDRGKDPKEKEEIIQWLRRSVMAEYNICTTNDNEELYVYDERRGVYLARQEWRLKAFCQSICHDIKTSVIDEVIEQVKRRTYVKRSRFDSDKNVINVRNGLLNIHTLEFREHSPDHLSTIQLPIKYDPNAKCPKILKFLKEVLKKEDIRVVLQLIGYCLYKTNRYEKAFIFYGQGSNGKSTLIHLMEHFLGFTDTYRNVSHVSLHDLAKNRFKPAELFGKSANLFADLGNKKISSEHWGIIKMLISGDSMSVERKGKHPFEFTPFSKLVFSCNEIPELPDNTYATWRRLILLEFENVFEENRDTNLINKITTEEEMSGLLNVALQNLRQLIRENEFAYTKDIETVRRAYDLNSNTMTMFVQERIEIAGPEDFETCINVYGAYLDLCVKEGRRCKTDAELGTYLKMALAGKWGGKSRKRINKIEQNVYYGIKLRPKQGDNSNNND